MEKKDIRYQTYIKLLQKELIPAFGCTEPIAVAFCAAKARELLGMEPQEVLIYASGNIIKNVKSVVVPKTGGLRGLEAAAAVGIFYGDAAQGLEVLTQVSEEEALAVASDMQRVSFRVEPLDSGHVLDLILQVRCADESALVHIQEEHTHIVECRKNGQRVETADAVTGIRKDACAHELSGQKAGDEKQDPSDVRLLQVVDIIDFARTVDLADVEMLLERQIAMNTAIAREGLDGEYGACIGQVLLHQDNRVRTRAKALAAAGSDARMNGCSLPVVILSGSGNQGMTASLPVIVYAQEYHKSREELYRALLVSDLLTLHLKSGIGRLSAYCGAISAGAAAGAGIAFLLTDSAEMVSHTIVNALAVTSGIVCDGAKASCAAKIAMAVDAGILGFEMYREGRQFYGGDGIVSKGVENTIRNVACLGHDGMKETDKKIIEIMVKDRE